MTTSYPAGLDSYTNPTASDELDDEIGTRTHSEFHADTNDAIEAIQGELGTDPSGSEATVKARIAATETVANAAATQAELNAHTGDTTDAHAGTAITNTPAGNIAATTVQAAINELDSEKQPLDTDLTAIAALASAANKVAYATGSGTWALADLTAFARTILDDANAAAALVTLGAAATSVVDVFTSSGTWTKRTGLTSVRVLAIAAGGGGGSGRRGADGAVRCGGGGGAGGGHLDISIAAADLSATETVTVGAAGAGGAAVTADDTNGNAGGVGGQARFGATTAKFLGLVETAGGGGGGTNAAGTGGTGRGGSTAGAAGGAASGSGGAGTAGVSAAIAAASGGAGGGFSAANAPAAGGDGGLVTNQIVGGTGGAATGAAGGAGSGATASASSVRPGSGGGGGGSGTGVAGGVGGAGGTWGAGGGGGAASQNGFASGAGGAGGPGIIVVINYF